MKIAIPSDDRTTITPHFGRTRGFLVYDVDGNAAKAEGYRSTSTEPKDDCACGASERPSRHQAVLDALNGCHVVIARGMGAHMYDDLLACGIDVFLTDVAGAQSAVEHFIAHSLPERQSLGCVD